MNIAHFDPPGCVATSLNKVRQPFVTENAEDSVQVDQSHPQRGCGEHQMTPGAADLRGSACRVESVYIGEHIGVNCEDIKQYVLVEVVNRRIWWVN